MIRRCLAASSLVLALATGPAGATAQEPRSFTATYHVDYGSMSVGRSTVTLKPDAAPGRWVFESRSKASGFARLVVGGELTQQSWLAIEPGGVRPLRYRFDDGTRDTKKDIALDFDWDTGRVTGTAEGRPVAAATSAGLQDALSQQLLLMHELAAGRRPERVPMIEKALVKMYEYRFLREERLQTPYGALDTLVFRATRVGGQKYTLQWFAPSLGHLMVRSEQHKGDKRLITMTLAGFSAP